MRQSRDSPQRRAAGRGARREDGLARPVTVVDFLALSDFPERFDLACCLRRLDYPVCMNRDPQQ